MIATGLGVLVGAILMPFLPDLARSTYLKGSTYYLTFSMLILSTLVYPFSIAKIHLNASQKSYHIHIGLAIQVLINAIGSVFAVYYGFGIPGLAGIYALATLCSSVYWLYVVDFKIKDILAIRKRAWKNIEIRNHIWRERKFSFYNELCGRINLFSDNIILGLIMGTQFVTPFFITQKLAILIQNQLQGIGDSTWAAIGQNYHSGNPKLFRSSVYKILKWVSILSVSFLVPLYTYNQHFITLWTGTKTFAGSNVTIVACLNAFFLAVITVLSNILVSTGKMKSLVPIYISSCVLNLSLNVFLTFKLGIVGPITATLITYVLIYIIGLTYLLNKEYSFTKWKLVFNWALPFFYGVGFAYTWTYFRQDISPLESVGWFQLIFEMGLNGSLCLFISFFILMGSEERKTSLQRLKKIILRR